MLAHCTCTDYGWYGEGHIANCELALEQEAIASDAEVQKLRAQVATLREALVRLCDSQLSSRDRESAIANELSALEATKEGT